MDRGIRRATSEAADVDAAVADIVAGIGQAPVALLLLFCSPAYNLTGVAAGIEEEFPGTPIAGCTTAGEITPFGYRTGTVTVIAFSAAHFTATARLIENMSAFSFEDGQTLVREMRQLHGEARGGRAGGTFALLISDGLSMSEEMLVSILGDAFEEIPLVGGSAGDDLMFRETRVLLGEIARKDAAIVTLISTDLPFQVFQTQHFVSSSEKLVVTRADPSRRLVAEINAEPAAAEYARLIGLRDGELNAQVFAAHPLVVRAGGRDYVRSIQRVHEDGSLSFFCAIDEGIVLTVANSIDLVANLVDTFENLKRSVGSIEAILGFDCVFRYLEMEQRQILGLVSKLFVENQVVGFSTYGEQFGMMHVNQTFTGIAFGTGQDHE
ncbi:nitric oxide-sensing protein NosP [Zavarzinia compransoris]|uniref:FIST domain containing protein n=2 Tax=Zavarzinia compransoris TaxID=1264899 RepID=A0A317E5E0_9PROT|nr:nitric oxide-sensing protein NosP [Zavarzinia compransoris]PWR22219.1 FIST domain containing protein [Zavarzinia compransoris]